jgi:phosphoribosylformylglycinamidine synthase
MKLPGSARGFALTITGRGELCAVDPYKGALAALGEATRNLACVGSPILAITDGLNNGPPSDPFENRRLSETIKGLADGLTALEIPVTGGNVSLYNATAAGAIPPTPMVGAIGVVEDVSRVPRGELTSDLVLVLLGTPSTQPATSAYGRVASGQLAGGAVSVDLAADRRLSTLFVEAIRRGMVRFAKDAGAGGLLVALAKACCRGRMGAAIAWPYPGRLDWQVFGEGSGLAWAGLEPRFADAFVAMAKNCGVPAERVGTSGGTRLSMKTGETSVLDASLEGLRKAFTAAETRG